MFQYLGDKLIPYIGVGMFQIQRLQYCDAGSLLTPSCNKAPFYPIELFSYQNMGEMLEIYSRSRPPHIPGSACEIITKESGGHPASFMALLKIYDIFRPDELIWPYFFEKFWRQHVNGIVYRTRQLGERGPVIRLLLTRLLCRSMISWEFDHNNLDPIEETLFNIGVLAARGHNRAKFTSSLILRASINVIHGRKLRHSSNLS